MTGPTILGRPMAVAQSRSVNTKDGTRHRQDGVCTTRILKGMATTKTALNTASNTLPQTLGALRQSEWNAERVSRSVKDELRDNLIAKIRARETIFPGIVGYEDTVVPQIVNAVLSRQNFILLGLRGQAKSRILRGLTTLLDPLVPVRRRL